MNNNCVVCNANPLSPLISIESMPIHCNVQWPSRESAITAEKGQIDLSYCPTCGHIYNHAFDDALMGYSEAYENSLHFSPQFNAYAQSLADRLIDTYAIQHKHIVEIGCGKGDFLSMLCEQGKNDGIGFDPSYEADRDGVIASSKVKVINDFYGKKYAELKTDLLCCRHVLEHIKEPLPFLRSIRQAVETSHQTVLYFEVPNALFSIREYGIWDIIYEHCSYFTPSSLKYLFEAAGLRILSQGDSFAGQFLYIEATPYQESAASIADIAKDLRHLQNDVELFSQKYTDKVDQWHTQLDAWLKKDQRAVIWGAGSKGVTFLSAMQPYAPEAIMAAVDLNPHKQGLYIAETGHKIVSPDALEQLQPEHIIVMNPAYRTEIAEMVKTIIPDTEVISV